ncbi:hypothetical protein L7F22_049061 [Adiantum nelumboides]|nr:hypothetical protein [Adiantum nelumboides]
MEKVKSEREAEDRGEDTCEDTGDAKDDDTSDGAAFCGGEKNVKCHLESDMKTPPRKCTMAVADGGSASVLSSSSKPMISTTLGIRFETIGDKSIARSSWKIQYPKQTQFCYTQEELHEEYGLNLEGKLYQHLGDADVIDQDWLSVFMKKREKGSKMFLHMMQLEFVDKFRLLFHKVYQSMPANKEITHKFATLFVYEQCPAARQDPTGRKVAWAAFGEQVLDHCEKLPGGTDKKVKIWLENNEGTSLQPLRLDNVGANQKSGQNALFSGSTSLFSASFISQQLKTEVEQILDSKRDALKGQLQEFHILRSSMKGAVDTDPDVLVIEGKMVALTSALTALGADACSSNIRDEVDCLKVLFDKLLEADMVSWNACIGGHAGSGNYVASLQVLELLKCAGLKPHGTMLTLILAACSHASLVAEGLEYLVLSRRDYDTLLDSKYCATILDLLGRAGDFSRAKIVLGMMPLTANQDTLLLLLGACGNVELAEHTFDIAIKVEHARAILYVLMSNVHAHAALLDHELMGGVGFYTKESKESLKVGTCLLL